MGERSELPTHIAHGKRFIVRTDDKLTAFLELELQGLAKSATLAMLSSEKNYFSRSGMRLAGHSYDGLQSKRV